MTSGSPEQRPEAPDPNETRPAESPEPSVEAIEAGRTFLDVAEDSDLWDDAE